LQFVGVGRQRKEAEQYQCAHRSPGPIDIFIRPRSV
jgi:hypothetical protein